MACHATVSKHTLSVQVAMLASYLAAVLHDYEHKGLNNDFLVRAGDDLAFTYNDISPSKCSPLHTLQGLLQCMLLLLPRASKHGQCR